MLAAGAGDRDSELENRGSLIPSGGALGWSTAQQKTTVSNKFILCQNVCSLQSMSENIHPEISVSRILAKYLNGAAS